jgi:AcrR family transcriptional regulator
VKSKEGSTKENLIKISVELFSRQGFSGTSIRQIASAEGIKESSIYYHFANKEAILQAILDYQIQGFQKAEEIIAEARPKLDSITDPVEAWMAGVQAFVAAMPPLSQKIGRVIFNEIYYHQGCRRFYLDVLQKARLELTEDILSSMVARGMIHCPDIPKTAFCYVSLLQGFDIKHNLQIMEGRDPEECRKELLEHIRYFIGNLKQF